jgi:hypothetical protein
MLICGHSNTHNLMCDWEWIQRLTMDFLKNEIEQYNLNLIDNDLSTNTTMQNNEQLSL